MPKMFLRGRGMGASSFTFCRGRATPTGQLFWCSWSNSVAVATAEGPRSMNSSMSLGRSMPAIMPRYSTSTTVLSTMAPRRALSRTLRRYVTRRMEFPCCRAAGPPVAICGWFELKDDKKRRCGPQRRRNLDGLVAVVFLERFFAIQAQRLHHRQVVKAEQAGVFALAGVGMFVEHPGRHTEDV